MFNISMCYVCSIFQGPTSAWIIRKEVSNDWVYITSKKKGLIYLPVSGWQYSDGIWQDDDTLTVTGKSIILTWS